jgi:NAD(P)H-dependent FMN reductase
LRSDARHNKVRTVARLLVVHHTPSPPTHALLDAVCSGASDPQIDDVEVVVRPALVASVVEALEADAYLLGTPANLGTMSGALKHFFDTAYYPCLDATAGRPWGLWVHGNNDVDGAVAAVEKIVTGLRWRRAAAPVRVIGAPDQADLDACWELGATVAAGLTLDG